MPPTRSLSVGLSMRFSSVFPCAVDAERETHHLARAVAQRADAMKGPLDAGAVVAAELADVADDVRDVLGEHLALAEDLLATREACLGEAPQVHDDLEEAVEPLERADALHDVRGEGAEDGLELVALVHGHDSTVRAFVASEDTRGSAPGARLSTRSAGQPRRRCARGYRATSGSSTACSLRPVTARPASTAPAR